MNGLDPDGNEYDVKYKTARDARNDFKRICNTKSINENVEYATMFYRTKSIVPGKKNPVETYSYTKPNRGDEDEVQLNYQLPSDVYDKSNPGRIIEASDELPNGDAHTHARAEQDWENPSEVDRNNLTTDRGVLFRPDGKVIEYDRNPANDHEIDK